MANQDVDEGVLTPEKAMRNAAMRRLKIARARENLIPFIQLCMSDPNFPDDSEKSLYEVEAHHRMLAESVERVHRREIKRFALAIPPQHGKSRILSRHGVAWKAGKNPNRHIIVGTYNSDFAREVGSDVRDVIRSPAFRQVFPGVTIAQDTQSKSDLNIQVNGGTVGSIRFRGRGESTTGRPADDFIIDDPYKDRGEADSALIRKECRDWYSSVVFSRLHVGSTVMIVHTRWNEDDLIGWLCDPEHPDHDAEKASRWTYINVPAVVTDKSLADTLGIELENPSDQAVIRQFGKAPMAALWKSKFPLEHLAEASENDKAIFSALYMGRPSPEEGDYFKTNMILEYGPHDLPHDLEYYAASDHALTTKEQNDANCLGCVGVDKNDEIWVLPDLVFERMETDQTVEEMLDQIRRHKPLIWWAERDHISKSIGPFLRQRMKEERVYCLIEESPATTDHRTRARAIQARMQMRMVHFPAFAPWWPVAKNELLKFPNGTHDDFVSFMAHMGMGLDRIFGAKKPKERQDNVIRVGSMAWVKATSNAQRRAEERVKMLKGM